MADITSINVIENPTDIADRLDATANWRESGFILRQDGDPTLLREAATLIRDLDAAISHAIAVKGSVGLSAWAISVLHEAITRRLRRVGS